MSKGTPIITLRIPSWQITGLKILAQKKNSTVSDILREYIDSVLWANNIRPDSPAQLPGQISTTDLMPEKE